jgi:hypothetical protein
MKTVIHSALHALVLLSVLAADVALRHRRSSWLPDEGIRGSMRLLNAALKSRNNNTPNAIISRSKVHKTASMAPFGR